MGENSGNALEVSKQEGDSSLKIKVLGRMLLGHQGPRRRDIPDKNLMQVSKKGRGYQNRAPSLLEPRVFFETH